MIGGIELGYYGRFVAKRNNETGQWYIRDDKSENTLLTMRESIDNQNLAYQIATHLNMIYDDGINEGKKIVQERLKKLLFSN